MQNITEDHLKKLFTKQYGQPALSKNEWKNFYEDNVLFIDPTQEQAGLDRYVQAQEKLIKRCDDIYLKTHKILISESVGFIEWEMGLKILNKEFIYPGITRLIFSESGKIKEHRDYFDFCGPTFGPIPILGSFIRWVYKKFAN